MMSTEAKRKEEGQWVEYVLLNEEQPLKHVLNM